MLTVKISDVARHPFAFQSEKRDQQRKMHSHVMCHEIILNTFKLKLKQNYCLQCFDVFLRFVPFDT